MTRRSNVEIEEGKHEGKASQVLVVAIDQYYHQWIESEHEAANPSHQISLRDQPEEQVGCWDSQCDHQCHSYLNSKSHIAQQNSPEGLVIEYKRGVQVIGQSCFKYTSHLEVIVGAVNAIRHPWNLREHEEVEEEGGDG